LTGFDLFPRRAGSSRPPGPRCVTVAVRCPHAGPEIFWLEPSARRAGGTGNGGHTQENVPAAGTDIVNARCSSGSRAGTGRGVAAQPGSPVRTTRRIRAGRSGRCVACRAPAAEDSPLAGARRVIAAGHVADVYRFDDLLCALVADLLGPESSVPAFPYAFKHCHQRCRARTGFRAGILELVGCASRHSRSSGDET